MPEKITCAQSVQVGSTLQRAVSTVLDVDAYDVIDVTVADGASNDEVQLQPGATVRLLMITCDSYQPALTYRVNASGNPARALDQPQLFVGAGAIALLDAAAPASLFVSNATGRAARVSIIVGRSA